MKVDRGNYDAIYGRAFERFLLDLARGYALEEERMLLERTGRKPSVLIREVQLKGEYPKTGFQIKTYDSVRELEQEQWYSLWGNPEFFDKDLKPLCAPEEMASYTLMWARGG